MPTLNLSINVPLDGVTASDILKDASKTVARILGKPESYVMVLIHGGVPMSFGGSEEPTAYGELISIGGLGPSVNGKLSAAIADILESKLSVDKSRFYILFYDVKLGFQTIDVVECNSRCPCGSKCLNRELQKGLQVALEVYKTEDRGWGVRALEQIPRGKFVVEYVGEVLTQGEASKPGLVYDDEHNVSYLFIADHPAVPKEDHLVVDGFKTSNVARFINHSCDGNLSIYRVYTETLDQRIFRIGLYACRDIEIGEELTYDYKCIPAKEPGAPSDDPVAIKCFCQAKTCRRVLLSAGS